MIKLNKAARKHERALRRSADPRLAIAPQDGVSLSSVSMQGFVGGINAPRKFEEPVSCGRTALKFVDHRGNDMRRAPTDARPGSVVKWKSRGAGVVYTPVTKQEQERRYARLKLNFALDNMLKHV